MSSIKLASNNKPRVALVYDRVNTPFGGAEQVLMALKECYPDAPLYAGVVDVSQAPWAHNWDIRTTWLGKQTWFARHHRLFPWLMPLLFEQFNFSAFDLIISVTSAEAKGVITQPHQLHLNYLLTPTRYLYSHKEQHMTSIPWVLQPIAKILLAYLRWWDRAASNRPDKIIAISKLVRERISQFYDRPADKIIYPPVRKPHQKIKTVLIPDLPEKFTLVISRLVAYKQIETVQMYCQSKNIPLVIVGAGPTFSKLKKLQTATTYLLGKQPDNIVRQLLKQAQLLWMPAKEDFGITALEAVSYGTPVVIHSKSGVAELLKNHVHGYHIDEVTQENLADAYNFIQNHTFDPSTLSKHVEQYFTERFVQQWKTTSTNYWKEHYEQYQS